MHTYEKLISKYSLLQYPNTNIAYDKSVKNLSDCSNT